MTILIAIFFLFAIISLSLITRVMVFKESWLNYRIIATKRFQDTLRRANKILKEVDKKQRPSKKDFDDLANEITKYGNGLLNVNEPSWKEILSYKSPADLDQNDSEQSNNNRSPDSRPRD